MNDIELDQLLDTWQAPVPSPSLRRTTLAAFPPRPPRRVFGIPVRWVFAAVLSAGGLAIGTSIWTDPKLGSFWGIAGELHTRTTRLVDPPSAKIRWWMKGGGHSIGDLPGGGMRGSGFLRDRAASRFYGYKYTVAPIGNGFFHVEFQPLDEAVLHRGGAFKMEGSIAQAAPLPAPKTIHDGDSFDVDLYADGTDRVFDRIQVSTLPLPKEPVQPPDPLRLTLDHVRVFENGALAGQNDKSLSGVCVWIHLPEEGRYLIALNPLGNPLFVAAGHVNGAVMEFTSNGRRFRIETAEPIAQPGGHPIYVFHQQAFENELNQDNPQTRGLMVGNAGPPAMHK
jgi:hypothetical protein